MPGGRIIVLRPQPGASATAQALRAAGHDPLVCPLFAVEQVAWAPVEASAYDALLVGSANVFRHGGPALADLKHLPVYAVGGKTARMALDLGFKVHGQGAGGLAAVLPMLSDDGHRHILRLSGEDHVDLPASRLVIDTRIVYRARALPMPDALRDALTGAETLMAPPVVLLHSARAAAHFAALVDAAGIARRTIRLALFAPALVDAAGDGWAGLGVAAATTDSALLDVADGLCQHKGRLQQGQKPET